MLRAKSLLVTQVLQHTSPLFRFAPMPEIDEEQWELNSSDMEEVRGYAITPDSEHSDDILSPPPIGNPNRCTVCTGEPIFRCLQCGFPVCGASACYFELCRLCDDNKFMCRHCHEAHARHHEREQTRVYAERWRPEMF